MKEDKLFVYGTLMRGMESPCGEALAKGSELLGRGSVQGRLYQVDPAYPGALESKDPSERISGELLKLRDPEKALAALDEYEGPEYSRRVTEVLLESGVVAKAWVYFYERPVEEGKAIPGGDYRRRG